VIPKVVTEVAFSTDPGAALPTWTDISAYVKNCNPDHGRDDEYADFAPGTNQIVLNNNDRRFDPTYAAGPYYPNVVPNRRIRQYVSGPLLGIEFWGDFEAGADGTAPEWTALNGALECKAGAETRQLQFVSSPTPRLGARIGRFEVASGDQFGATSGERCEVRRGTPNGGYGTGNLEGLVVCTQFSTRFLAPWTLTGEGIFQQTHDSGSTYGAPMFRWRMGSTSNIEFRVVTGNYPNGTDASNGVNSSTSLTHTGLAFATDTWFDFRHAIFYTQGQTGWYIAQMKLSSSSAWTDVARMASVQTLPSIGGAASSTSQFDKCGFYRGTPQASTNVVYHDGYQVGHTFADVGYGTQNADSRWNAPGWEDRLNLVESQAGNGDFETGSGGQTNAGGGTTTRTRVNTRSKFGSWSLEVDPDGAASGQGVFFTKISALTRFDIVVGHTYTASCWFSGDGFQTARIGIEWFTSGGASIQTDFCVPRALRTDFRRLFVTAVAPATAVTCRIRCGNSGTSGNIFWLDGVALWEGELDHFLFEGYVDNWATDWPDRLFQSEVTVSCTDRTKVVGIRAQPASNPNVEDYESVISFDEPSFYYRLGEPEGTKLVSHVRRTKHKLSVGGGSAEAYHHVIRRWKTRESRAKAEGVSGPSGTFKNNPILGVPGLIDGDPDTAVLFTAADDEYARIPLDVSDTVDTNKLTVEAWVNPTTLPVANPVVAGPTLASGGTPIWILQLTTGGQVVAYLQFPSASALINSVGTIAAGVRSHLAMAWDGHTFSVYINGVLDSSNTYSGRKITQGDTNQFLYIGLNDFTNANFDGVIDEVAVFEKGLSAARILAHYQAGLRGYNQELTGTRISNVLATTGLGFDTALSPGGRQILPQRQFGQSSLEPIDQAVAAEGGVSGFFFNAAGVGVFHDRNFRDLYPFTVNQATFDDDPTVSGALAYSNLGFDNGAKYLANQVRVEAQGGTTQEVSDSASQTSFLLATAEQSGVMMVSDDDALEEANWLLSRSKTPRWRITSVTFDADEYAYPDQLGQALSRECGDAVTVKRRPKAGAVFSQISSVEKVTHAIDFEQKTWVTTFGLAPLADDLATGWVLGVPGATELESTMVLN
jgi:hypothetical protein